MIYLWHLAVLFKKNGKRMGIDTYFSMLPTFPYVVKCILHGFLWEMDFFKATWLGGIRRLVERKIHRTWKPYEMHIIPDNAVLGLFVHYYLAPGGGCEVLFSPGLSVCLSVCLCVCVRPIFWYFISRLLEEISIWNSYRILIGLYPIHWKTLTFIGQRSRSQGRYIAFWRYSQITKTEP